MMRELGKFVKFGTPWLLFLDPVLPAERLDVNLFGLTGGVLLGFVPIGCCEESSPACYQS